MVLLIKIIVKFVNFYRFPHNKKQQFYKDDGGDKKATVADFNISRM